MMNDASNTATLPAPKTTLRTQKPWLWNIVLLDDDDHTVDYVVELMNKVFGHKVEDGHEIAERVNRDGRAVCYTTHRELAELKQEMIHSFGRDVQVKGCLGAMSAILEPAAPTDGE